jgi:hypothetical protein
MAILPVSLDYTSKDFDSIRERLMGLIRSVFPDWTDFNRTNFGNILMELGAFVGDILCFYQDNQAAESRIVTATQRKNLIALSKLVSFRVATATAATATLTLTIPAPAAGDVTIAAGRKFKTANVVSPSTFQVLEEVVLPAGSTSASASVENSESWLSTFASTLRANQEYRLPQKPYLDGSARLSAGDGIYTEVSNFLDSGPTDRHYTTTVDQNGQCTVRFGNGINGTIPTGTISAPYKTGGGSRGSVLAGTIVKPEGSFVDSFGTPVALSSTNPLPATPGTNRMTIAQIKLLAPESPRVAGRTIAREDYEINARAVTGVARALMLTSDETSMIPEGEGKLFLIPVGGGDPTEVLKEQVLDMVTMSADDYLAKWGVEGGNPNQVSFHVDVVAAARQDVDIQTTIYLRAGYTSDAKKAEVKAAILANLAAWFAVQNADGSPNTNVDFGYNVKDVHGEPAGEIAWSDLFDVVKDTTGVRKIDDSSTGFILNGARSDVAVDLYKFPRLGTVVIYDGDHGTVL